MNYLGVDPDTSHIGMVLMRKDGNMSFFLTRVEGEDAHHRVTPMTEALRRVVTMIHDVLPDEEELRLAVEWPLPRPGDPNPRNIAELMAFAGMAVQAISELTPSKTYLPTPSDWKGQVPKHEKHNRIVQKAGVVIVREALQRAKIPCPPDLGAFKAPFSGMASHVLDALGIAQWMMEREAIYRKAGLL